MLKKLNTEELNIKKIKKLWNKMQNYLKLGSSLAKITFVPCRGRQYIQNCGKGDFWNQE